MRKWIARLLVLALVLSALPGMTALAAEDWRMQMFEFTTQTPFGEQTLTAVALDSDESQSFYLFVPPDLAENTFTFHAYHPFHGDWQYDIPEGEALTFQNYPSEYAISAVDRGGGLIDTFFLTVGNLPLDEWQDQFAMTTVPIAYVDAATGQTLETGVFGPVGAGIYDIYPVPRTLGFNWQLKSDSPVRVTVQGGVASPASVQFAYSQIVTAPPATPTPRPAVITVRYLDADTGAALCPAETLTYGDGDWLISAQPSFIPTDYYMVGSSSAVVTVQNGKASPQEVIFRYRRLATATPPATPTPAPARVTVHLLDASGRELARYPYTVTAAGQVRIPLLAAYIPRGYTAEGVVEQTVTVYANGTAYPPDVYYTLRPEVVETAIPHGALINRWSRTVSTVRFREGPTTSDPIIRSLGNGAWVWAIREVYNAYGEWWTYCLVDGRYGYISSTYLSVLTQAESDQRQRTLYTPVPYIDWTQPTPTPRPTATPTPRPTATPVPTAAPGISYAYTRSSNVYLRVAPSVRSAMVAVLPRSTAVFLAGQTVSTEDGQVWYGVTCNGQAGYIRADLLRPMTRTEQTNYLRARAQATAAPTTAPNYQSVFCYGYVADWNGTPLRRTPSASAQSLTWLSRYALCRVYGPYTYGGETWFNVSCRVGSSQYTGYVPASALKMLGEEELAAFVETPEYFSGN